jgi:hypothetical protein
MMPQQGDRRPKSTTIMPTIMMKAFTQLHHVFRPLMVIVEANSSLPPQHHHRKRPSAGRNTTSAP